MAINQIESAARNQGNCAQAISKENRLKFAAERNQILLKAVLAAVAIRTRSLPCRPTSPR